MSPINQAKLFYSTNSMVLQLRVQVVREDSAFSLQGAGKSGDPREKGSGIQR